jgi:RNA polymerase sigma factor (sigma-70 family)
MSEAATGLRGLLSTACGQSAADGVVVDSARREAAFEELLRLVMIYIRAGMGRRLRDHRESMDVCQSVATSFIEDFETGRINFETEAQLAAYLQRVVQHKLADLARADAALKRGGGAQVGRLDAQGDVVGQPTAREADAASADIRRDEALALLLATLSEEDQVLVRMRRQGLSWEQIAQSLGRESAALRQHFSRIQKRLGQSFE